VSNWETRPEEAEMPDQLVSTGIQRKAWEVYNILREGAEYSGSLKGWAWQGHLGEELIEALDISQPYLSILTGHLKRMGCIQVFKHGARYTKSIIEIIKPPTLDLWATEDKHTSGVFNKSDRRDQLMRDIVNRIEVLERTVNGLVGTSQ